MRVITLDGNIVVSVKNVTDGYILGVNEFKSEVGEIGQILQQDGTFIDPEPVPVEPQPTLEDKINYIYYKQMGVF